MNIEIGHDSNCPYLFLIVTLVRNVTRYLRFLKCVHGLLLRNGCSLWFWHSFSSIIIDMLMGLENMLVPRFFPNSNVTIVTMMLLALFAWGGNFSAQQLATVTFHIPCFNDTWSSVLQWIGTRGSQKTWCVFLYIITIVTFISSTLIGLFLFLIYWYNAPRYSVYKALVHFCWNWSGQPVHKISW